MQKFSIAVQQNLSLVERVQLSFLLIRDRKNRFDSENRYMYGATLESNERTWFANQSLKHINLPVFWIRERAIRCQILIDRGNDIRLIFIIFIPRQNYPMLIVIYFKGHPLTSHR